MSSWGMNVHRVDIFLSPLIPHSEARWVQEPIPTVLEQRWGTPWQQLSGILNKQTNKPTLDKSQGHKAFPVFFKKKTICLCFKIVGPNCFWAFGKWQAINNDGCNSFKGPIWYKFLLPMFSNMCLQPVIHILHWEFHWIICGFSLQKDIP